MTESVKCDNESRCVTGADDRQDCLCSSVQ